ncbi:MAG: NAD-dependent epimerase/dehydratase family protein [Promethearchaeota archaeon]
MGSYRIGIVGGSGFVGSSLASHLSNHFEVAVYDKKPISENLKGKASFHQCDVTKYDEVKKSIKDVDLVIHAAIVQIPLINIKKRLGYEVNVLGAQNVCEVVSKADSISGLILTSSWHVFGDAGFQHVKDGDFGSRCNTREDRNKYYTLTKIVQENIVRVYDEMSEKIYGTIRMGTVLGEGMPEKTAANIFITAGLKGEAITPYAHSMHRPMFYVDINDVCEAFESFAWKMLNDEVKRTGDSSCHIFNLTYPTPLAILDLATIVRDAIIKQSQGEIRPKIEIIDKGLPNLYEASCGEPVTIDMRKVKQFLGVKGMTSPKVAIERIVAQRLHSR